MSEGDPPTGRRPRPRGGKSHQRKAKRQRFFEAVKPEEALPIEISEPEEATPEPEPTVQGLLLQNPLERIGVKEVVSLIL